MSLGSRIAKRSRVAVFAQLTSTPREPLLFLYPSWIRNNSTASSAPLQHESHAEPVVQQQPVLIPKHAATLCEDPAVLDKRFNRPKAASASDQHALNTNDASPKSRPPNIATEDGIASLQKEQSNLKDTTSSAATEKMVRKLLGLQEISDDARQSASSLRKAYQAVKREELQLWTPDWRTVLATLVKHTPEHGQWLSKALKFEIPEDALVKLLGGIDDYYAEIGDKYGCRIELGGRDDVTMKISTLVISGPAVAISKCAAEILGIAPNVEITPFKNGLASAETGALQDGTEVPGNVSHIYDSGVKIRNVMVSGPPRCAPGVQQRRPEDIPKPEKWDQHSFLDYVRDLTTSSLTNHVNRFGYSSTEDRHAVIASYLRELFNTPSLRPSITREACHEAMKYWVRGNHIQDARILFVQMEILKLQMVPETFNILLAGAAKFEDIHNFHFILHLMLNRGITPNGRTWNHFMVAFSDVKIKLHILTAMQKKGLLNHPQTMLEATAQLASHEIEASLEQNQTQKDFIAHMDSRYGSDWVSSSSGNHILHVLGAHGLISRCWEFLHFMDSRHIVPDKYSVHTVLHHCKQAVNLKGAIEILRSLPKSMRFLANEETYRIMFDLAWKLSYYNVAKVVWRYACLSGATSFDMRRRVFQTMKESNLVDLPKSHKGRFKRFLGPVIIGIDTIKDHPSRYLERMFPVIEYERLLRREEARMEKAAMKQSFAQPNETEPSVSEPDVSESGASEASVPDDWANFSPIEPQDKSRTKEQESKQTDKLNEYEQSASKASQSTEEDPHPSHESEQSEAKDPQPTEENPNDSHESKQSVSKVVQIRLKSPFTREQFEAHRSSPAYQKQLEAHRSSPAYQEHLKRLERPLILEPWSPSTFGNRIPYYKSQILKDILYADLEVFKQWRPVKPFEDMLAEALERDTEWRQEEGYKEKQLDWFMDGRAVSVSIATRTGLVKEFEWK